MEIDDLIEILQRVKRCDTALSLLNLITTNMLFNEDLGHEKNKYRDGVKSYILEAIALIEGKK
jgi:hypothetical protein